MATRVHILKRIGAGSMAEVFVARLERDGVVDDRLVALKRMLPHLASDPRAKEMFIDEARLSEQLIHPHIARVVHIDETEDEPFIALEYVDGASLAHLLEVRGDSKLEAPLALFVARAVASALAFAHALKGENGELLDVVHRDVSPENILVSRAGEVKLIDFGIAKARGRNRRTRTGAILGKTLFMSPEQALGQPATSSSDLFSLGSVLYLLLAGLAPFEGKTELDRMTAVAQVAHRPLAEVAPELPSSVPALVEELLQRSPAARPASADVVRSRLSDILVEGGADPSALTAPELGALVQRYCGPADVFFEDFDEKTPTAI